MDEKTLRAERGAIDGTRTLAKALNASEVRQVSEENLPHLISAYEEVIAAITNNSMKEFPDA